MNDSYKAVVIGYGKMGKNQARILQNHPDFDLVAVCDIVQEALDTATAELEVKGYTDLDTMMEAEQPAVVLVINHQRRIGADLVQVKELIDSGAIGDVNVVRGHCAGDFLSGGTHVADSLMFLVGDPEVEWVVGQVVRDPEAVRKELERFGDYQGHPIESGAMAIAQLPNGVRAEFFTGDLRQNGRHYQDYVIGGTKGQIWRLSDSAKPQNLYTANGETGGTHIQDESLKGIPAPDGNGPWRPVETEKDGQTGIYRGYSFLAGSLRDGTPHPMNGDIALNHFQIALGLFESARTGKRVYPPVQADRFPLEIMIEAGRFE